MGGGGYGKCQPATQKTLLQLQSNSTSKHQDQVHNEAALETLIGRTFFSSLSSFYWDSHLALITQNAVFAWTLIKSEQIISFKLVLFALGEEWAHTLFAGDFCELFMYPPLVRIEGRVRHSPHPQSLQKGVGSLTSQQTV